MGSLSGGWVQMNIGAHDPNSFLRGTATFTNGPCLGESRTIKSFSLISGTTYRFDYYVPINRNPQLAGPVQPNTQMLFGCDKSLDVCTNRFANQTRFGATPHVPKPESAI